ncbi:MAG TPA: PAC2 family protein [Acidimicrobiales bacterium]|jgi:proteasome assembly chaperone (PAC2) family protein
MPYVTRRGQPQLRNPVLVAGFEGWNDAGEAASFAARFLAERWDAEVFAEIDPEDFFDFTSTRPQVRLDEGMQREIVWPATTMSAAAIPGGSRDVIFLIGTEPQLRWRTFCEEIVAVAAEHDVRLVVTLGALLAEVPHSRPVHVVGTTQDPSLVRSLGLQQSQYEGPTGIVGVLHDTFRRTGVPAVALWATVPTYVPSAPSPKAALALLERLAHLLRAPVATTDLEIASAAYERQIDELVAEDDDTAAYVARLEESVDEEAVSPPLTEDVSSEDLIAEVERFLRDNGG